MLKLYNTLQRKITPFEPLQKNVVKMYSCGPTVYDYAHIGNMRAYLFMDLLRRVLKWDGYKIEGVMNITDVGHMTSNEDEGEDKMEVASKREQKSPWEIASYYTNFFMSQAHKLNIDLPEKIVKATSEIDEMIEFVKKLIKNGFAYETSKGIYFDVTKYEDYGKLSNTKLEDKLHGARIDVDPEKHNPADFTLWVKAPKEHIMQWDSPWGKGYPGWHIECSAISMKNLGKQIDIHTGGIDHVTVHHENEIAQNYGCAHKQVVNRWMHVEFLQVDGGKMSKSLQNFYTVDDLEEKGFRALDFKYFCFNAHYSKKLNFTLEGLNSAHTALTRLYELTLAHKSEPSVKTKSSVLQSYRAKFEEAINNDLNAPLALSVVWTMLKNEPKSKDIYALLCEFDQVFGLNLDKAEFDVEIEKTIENQNAVIPGDIIFLAEKRKLAKKEKDFALADELRDEIFDLGYLITDTKDGYDLTKQDQ